MSIESQNSKLKFLKRVPRVKSQDSQTSRKPPNIFMNYFRNLSSESDESQVKKNLIGIGFCNVFYNID